MRWLKRERRKASIPLAGLLLLLVLMVWIPVSAAGASKRALGLATPVTGTVQATPTEDATVTALNKEKLKGEIAQQQHTENWLWSNGATILSSFFSTLVIVIGALIAFWRWRGDQRTEQEKRAEERFQKVVEGLGSERPEAKVGAAITLRTFLEPGYERFYRQAFDLAVAHLRLRKTEASPPGPLSRLRVLLRGNGATPTASIPLDSLSQALITVFKESFPLARQEEVKNTKAQFDPQLLDATAIRLDKAYLPGRDLIEGWMPEASLQKANLRSARLNHVNLAGANLIEASLNTAVLPSANLSGVTFTDAILEWAELTKAILDDANLTRVNLTHATLIKTSLGETNLTGADLTDADLTDADLTDADLTDADLTSANLSGANPEAAKSLTGTKMHGVIGLKKNQCDICRNRGASLKDIDVAV